MLVSRSNHRAEFLRDDDLKKEIQLCSSKGALRDGENTAGEDLAPGARRFPGSGVSKYIRRQSSRGIVSWRSRSSSSLGIQEYLGYLRLVENALRHEKLRKDL